MQRGPKAKPPRLTYSIFRSDCHLPAMESADKRLRPVCACRRLSASNWVLKLKIPRRRGLKSRCYMSLVHGTLRINVRNSQSPMLAISSTSYAELRLCHASWTAAQQTLFQYPSAESHQHFPMDELTQEQALVTEVRSSR